MARLRPTAVASRPRIAPLPAMNESPGAYRLTAPSRDAPTSEVRKSVGFGQFAYQSWSFRKHRVVVYMNGRAELYRVTEAGLEHFVGYLGAVLETAS